MVEEGSILHVQLSLLLSAILAHIEVPCRMAQPAGSVTVLTEGAIL